MAVGSALGQVENRSDRPVPVYRLPEFAMLSTIELIRSDDGSGSFAIRRFKNLPRGGIAGVDFCGVATLLPSSNAEEPGAVVKILALRLRPDLNGPADYPAAWAAAIRRGQVQSVPAGCYAVIPLLTNQEAADWQGRVIDAQRRQMGRPALEIDGKGFRPVECP